MTPAPRIIVCGSRRWHDREKIANRLAELPGDSTVVVGYDPEQDRPQGADRIAYQEGQKLGLLVEAHPAQWERYGKRGDRKNPAGHIRNEEMAASGAVLCIAFWDGLSTGTLGMIARAEKHKIPVEVIRP